MIYVGYQGIGKSTLADKDLKYIDLESSNTFIDGKRPENWEKMYVNFAISLNEQGYNVFISSHKVVREELNKRNHKFYAIVPSLDLKEKWIEKLRDRYYNTLLTKDFKAYMNGKECFEENVKDIMSDSENCIVLDNINYKLEKVLKEYEY